MQKTKWRVFVADAFADRLFCGNQAGVVLLKEGRDYPAPETMRKIAGELKHSETAFVKRLAKNSFQIRYFTPVKEVELCGHATIGAFHVLVEQGMIQEGSFQLETMGQRLEVSVDREGIWMEMAPPRVVSVLNHKEAEELYAAYGLTCGDAPEGMFPRIINTGLSDILLPVANTKALNRAVQDAARVEALSRLHEVVGVHMFTVDGVSETTAECRNFAPLYGIPEEAATGTANGALTWYLFEEGLIREQEVNLFLQGEAMGKPSYVKSILKRKPDTKEPVIVIGGSAVISLEGILAGEESDAE